MHQIFGIIPAVVGDIGLISLLVAMVERMSRFTLIRLVSSKEALGVSAYIIEALKPYLDKVLTHTYDNGKEFALHEILTDVLEAQAYFAHPYHSW
ncbi:MAG: IS30 family transposase, partial [Akkermansiaceae bacterium]|nr:IS30 family transposase [Akkermansiaceae bacterium]